MRRARSLFTVLALSVMGCGSDLTVPSASPDADGAPEAPDAGDPDGEGGGVGAGAGDASDVAPVGPEDYAAFSLTFSRLYCRRLFSCCDAADRTAIIGMDDETTCVRKENEVVLGVGMDYLDRGVSFYDRGAATVCFASLTSDPCGAVFSHENGRLVACQGGVLKGLGANGTECEGDIECLSNRCTVNSGCAPPLAPLCTADEFYDGKTAACAPRRQRGEDCVNSSSCAGDLICLGKKCADPLPDGQVCSSPSDCAGTCTSFSGGVCRPAVCGGA